MTIKNFLKPLILTLGLICCLLGELIIREVHSADNEICPVSPSSLAGIPKGECLMPPKGFALTIYEMGLCKSDPLAGTLKTEEDT